ncbi:hypothetical protein BRADI_4g42920v3 [Brachypodium distachyon]|uniref:RING-type domain-containing protein n=1 Tax=Brachypodium distachyon TaxID=15368 RepID=I1IUH4_BRADI|nr:hypothetical protein BRADI_4g42920v3 [Brachypodium distachyon]
MKMTCRGWCSPSAAALHVLPPASRRPGAPPASSAAMAALRETTGSESGEKSCALCLEEFKAEEKLREMSCGHCYHEGCIFPWLRVSGPARSAANGCREEKQGDGWLDAGSV